MFKEMLTERQVVEKLENIRTELYGIRDLAVTNIDAEVNPVINELNDLLAEYDE